MGSGNLSAWRCKAVLSDPLSGGPVPCRAVLGRIHHGRLIVCVTTVNGTPEGLLRVQCPACGMYRVWRPDRRDAGPI